MTEYPNYKQENTQTVLGGTVDRICPTVGEEKVDVSVPVTIVPFAHAKTPKIKCCGEPKITQGEPSCKGKINGVCTFTISQTIGVEVPVAFGATATVGETYVECGCAKADNKCQNDGCLK